MEKGQACGGVLSYITNAESSITSLCSCARDHQLQHSFTHKPHAKGPGIVQIDTLCVSQLHVVGPRLAYKQHHFIKSRPLDGVCRRPFACKLSFLKLSRVHRTHTCAVLSHDTGAPCSAANCPPRCSNCIPHSLCSSKTDIKCACVHVRAHKQGP